MHGVYYVTGCPRCEQEIAIGPISFSGIPIKVRCRCGVVSEYLVYGNSTMVVYCRSGEVQGAVFGWREEKKE